MNNIFNILRLLILIGLGSCSDSRNQVSTSVAGNSETAADKNANNAQADDKRMEKIFVADAVASNYAEIKIIQLALQRSVSSEIKEVASSLLEDQTEILNDLKVLAQNKAFSVPVEETDKEKNEKEDLDSQHGKGFSKSWCTQIIEKHTSQINKFEKALGDTKDSELRTFINKTLPHLKSHVGKLKTCLEKI